MGVDVTFAGAATSSRYFRLLGIIRSPAIGHNRVRLIDLALDIPFLLQFAQARKLFQIDPIPASGRCGLVGDQQVETNEWDLKSRHVQ
jgi:hypothetical protein